MATEVDCDHEYTHKYWYGFCDYLKKYYYNLQFGIKRDFKQSKRKHKVLDFGKLIGYQAIQRAKKIIKKYPEIITVECDDNYHAGSDLFLIPHPDMGVSIVFIPQCTNEQGVFFLYPSHLREFIRELQKLEKQL